jgi:YVTN family beta-propeller protein
VGARIALTDVVDLAVRRNEPWAVRAGGEIARIDPEGGIVTQAITLSSVTTPVGLAVGQNSVWVASSPGATGTASVYRVDPDTNEVVATIRVGGNPSGIAVGESAVWVADAQRHGIIKIDPLTNMVVARTAIGNRPSAIAAAAGAIWVTVT